MRRSAALLIFDPLNRFRPSIWDPIARELGISWGEAEAIHWNIGEAGLTPTALTALSEPSMEKRESSKTSSNELPDASGVKTKSSSKPVLRLRFPAPNQEIAEGRAQHFEPTRPSKLQPEEIVRLKRTETTVDQAQPYDPIRSSQAGVLSSSLHTTPAVNLTLEGRRQAQAAGDKLRAKRTPSRHRKVAIAVDDHTSHQNRWASYKSPSSTFLPKESTNIPEGFDGPSLTSEGRRQAQVAGDKLCYRTNPIRHSRPSRGLISDHGISKNRWSTYGPRATRSDERQDMQADPKEKALSGDTKEQERSEQPSLLEVFEAELGKKISMDTLQDNARTILPEAAAAATVSMSETTPQPNDSSNISAPVQSGPSAQESNPLLDGLKMINYHLEGLTVGDENILQGFSGAIGEGFRAAIGSVSTFMRGVTNGLQEASNMTRQAAERTRKVDFRIIDDTILGLRIVAEDMTALGQEILPKRPETSHEREEATVKSTARSESSKSATLPEEDTISSSESKAAPSESIFLAEDSQAPSTAGPPCSISATKPTDGPKTIKIGQGRSPRFVSDIPVTVTRNSSPDSRRMSRNLGMDRVPRYHKPGPIHLPHHAPLAQPIRAVETQGSATRTGYVDHLRRYHSTENTDEADVNQSTTLPAAAAAAARFPTMAQFESQNFTSNVPFPPLPSMSMEPLVPLRANFRSESKKPDQKSQLLSEKHIKSQPEASADTSMTHRVIHSSHFMGPGANRWLSPHPSQDPLPMQIQDTPLPSLSENGGAGTNHALEGSHGQLRLLEQQNKKGLLIAQQEQDRIRSDRARTSSALASGKLILDAKEEQQAPSNIAQPPVSFLPHTLNIDPNYNHTLQDCQMQLTPRQQSTLEGLLKQQDSAPLPRPLEEPETLSLNEPSAGSNGSSAVQSFQTSLQEIVADQKKKRQSFKEQEEQVVVPDDVKVPGAFPSGERNDLVGQPEENGPFGPAFNPETGLYNKDTRNYLATHPIPWYSPLPSTMNKAESLSRLSSAARLAEPFDPLEAEPSVRSHLTEGVRRNATVAGTDSRHNARLRRPYSEAFDGSGRVEWDTFLQPPQAPQFTKSQFAIHPSDCHPLSKGSCVNDKESASKPEFRALGSKFPFEDPDDWHWTNPAIRERAQASRLASEYYDHGASWAVDPCEVDRERCFDVDERKSSPPPRVTPPGPDFFFNNHKEHKSLHVPRNKKSSKPRTPARASTISFKDWDERHKIYDCVSRLRELGFENTEDDNGPESRLLQYASAVGGDLVAAIEMIDEEQRAYKEKEKDAVEFTDSI